MGYMRHHAILVTGWDAELLKKAHRKAKALGNAVTPLSTSKTNGYLTFVVLPDGSKEGWDESNAGDQARAEFKTWLYTDCRYESNEGWKVDWAEVMYGDDEGELSVRGAGR